MIVESIERRVLGALELVDALTGLRVRRPLRLEGAGLVLARNAGGLYVIRSAAGLEEHEGAFERPPHEPAFGTFSFAVTVRDPQRTYLSRRCIVRLPRRDAPRDDPDSLLSPQRVSLTRSAAAPSEPAWAVLRTRVRVPGAEDIGVANAVLRLTPQVNGHGSIVALTDSLGEALLAVSGVPPILSGPGGSLVREFDGDLQIVIDPQVARRSGTQPMPLADPDEIERRRASGAPEVQTLAGTRVKLSAGRGSRVVLEVALP